MMAQDIAGRSAVHTGLIGLALASGLLGASALWQGQWRSVLLYGVLLAACTALAYRHNRADHEPSGRLNRVVSWLLLLSVAALSIRQLQQGDGVAFWALCLAPLAFLLLSKQAPWVFLGLYSLVFVGVLASVRSGYALWLNLGVYALALACSGLWLLWGQRYLSQLAALANVHAAIDVYNERQLSSDLLTQTMRAQRNNSRLCVLCLSFDAIEPCQQCVADLLSITKHVGDLYCVSTLKPLLMIPYADTDWLAQCECNVRTSVERFGGSLARLDLDHTADVDALFEQVTQATEQAADRGAHA